MKRNIYRTLLWVTIVVAWGSMGYAESVLNTTTGASSTNDASVTKSNNIEVTAISNAIIQNDVSLSANTGANTASSNTGNGSVNSGVIVGSVGVMNTFNTSNLTLPSVSSFFRPITSNNSHTGALSNNTAGFSNTNKLAVITTNSADVSNEIAGILSTGKNSASRNTGNGTVRSGRISFAVNLENIGNLVDIILGRGGGVPETPPDQPIILGRGGGVAELTSEATTLPRAGGLDNTVFALLSAAAITFLAMLFTNRKLKYRIRSSLRLV